MPRIGRFVFAVSLLIAAPGAAQTTPSADPPLRRWLEFQTLTLGTRYRLIESNSDNVTSNDLQYREIIRARVNFDAKRRYTVTFGAASGNSFISSWDYTGLGINDGDFHNHYLKQLYFAAVPIDGLEFQYGGFYISRGENTEFITYDDDGFAMGERVSVRRPKSLYLDEITVTRARIGPANAPNINQRWEYLDDPDYTQVLAMKRFSPNVAGSLDYSTQASADTVRVGVALRFRPNPVASALRYEQYHRFSPDSADGFVVMADRSVTKWVRAQFGLASVDEFYGGLNADRIQRGTRMIAIANVPLTGPLSASFFVTQAFHADYSLSNRTRFDAVLTWDIANTLRQTGKF